MAQLTCELNRLSQKEGESTELTVGEVFFYICKGDIPNLKTESLELRLDKEFKYKLKLLAVDIKSSNEIRLMVTSYEVGEHKIPAVQLVDSESSVVLGDLSFKVNSVMDPQNPVKEPLGPIAPFQMSLATEYWAALLIIIAFVVSAVIWRIFRRQQKRKLLKKMEIDQYAQNPLHQYYTATRRMQRLSSIGSKAGANLEDKRKFISEVERALQIYLARKFQVPTLYWSPRRVAREIRRTNAFVYSQIRRDYKKIFAEIERAQKSVSGKSKNELSERDCLQILEMSRKFVEHIETLTNKEEQL